MSSCGSFLWRLTSPQNTHTHAHTHIIKICLNIYAVQQDKQIFLMIEFIHHVC